MVDQTTSATPTGTAYAARAAAAYNEDLRRGVRREAEGVRA